MNVVSTSTPVLPLPENSVRATSVENEIVVRRRLPNANAGNIGNIIQISGKVQITPRQSCRTVGVRESFKMRASKFDFRHGGLKEGMCQRRKEYKGRKRRERRHPRICGNNECSRKMSSKYIPGMGRAHVCWHGIPP